MAPPGGAPQATGSADDRAVVSQQPLHRPATSVARSPLPRLAAGAAPEGARKDDVVNGRTYRASGDARPACSGAGRGR
jgi:hypothetical protein